MSLTLEDIKARCEVDGDCWLWQGSTSSQGMPRMRLNGGQFYVVHLVYHALCGNPRSKGYLLRRRCGNRLCVSPSCIVRKTFSQATRDTWRKGRRTGRAAAVDPARSNFAKLTWESVAALRARGDERAADLAREFGVSESTVNEIRCFRTWRPRGSSVFNWRGQ